METKITNQNTKIYSKKRSLSLTMGIFSVLLLFLVIIIFIVSSSMFFNIFITKSGFESIFNYEKIFIQVIRIILIISFILAFIGIIKGIKEIKSSKKQAIIGITLSLIGLITTVVIGLWFELHLFSIST